MVKRGPSQRRSSSVVDLERRPLPRRGGLPRPPSEIDPSLPTTERIFQAAAKLFIERGYDGASMSEIAALVDVSKAGLYHFYENKEELLFAIMSRGMQSFAENVVTPARAIDDPLQRLRFIIRRQILDIDGAGQWPRVPMRAVERDTFALTEEHRLAITASKAAYFRLLKGTLAELKAEGLLHEDLDVAVSAHSLIGMILWVPQWRHTDSHLGLDEVIEQITRLATRGLLKPGAWPAQGTRQDGRA